MAKRTAARRSLTKAPIGDMRDRISIERRTSTPPNIGQNDNVIVHTVVKSVWAKVNISKDSNQGIQDFNGVNTNDAFRVRFVIREDSSLALASSDTVIRWRDEIYKIRSTKPIDERLEFTEITATLWGDDTQGANQ